MVMTLLNERETALSRKFDKLKPSFCCASTVMGRLTQVDPFADTSSFWYVFIYYFDIF